MEQKIEEKVARHKKYFWHKGPIVRYLSIQHEKMRELVGWLMEELSGILQRRFLFPKAMTQN